MGNKMYYWGIFWKISKYTLDAPKKAVIEN